MTAGDINRQIVESGGSTSRRYPVGSTYALRFYKPKETTPANKPNKDIYGNWSKFA